MTLEKESSKDDRILDMEGLKVFVDSRSILYLNGTKVITSTAKTDPDSSLKIRTPRIACGCGEMFEA